MRRHVAAGIVEDEDAAGFELWDEGLPAPGGEAIAVDGTLGHARGDALVAEAGAEGQPLALLVRHPGEQRPAPVAAGVQVMLVAGPPLIDEEKTPDERRVYPAPEPEPASRAAGDIRAILLLWRRVSLWDGPPLFPGIGYEVGA